MSVTSLRSEPCRARRPVDVDDLLGNLAVPGCIQQVGGALSGSGALRRQKFDKSGAVDLVGADDNHCPKPAISLYPEGRIPMPTMRLSRSQTGNPSNCVRYSGGMVIRTQRHWPPMAFGKTASSPSATTSCSGIRCASPSSTAADSIANAPGHSGCRACWARNSRKRSPEEYAPARAPGRNSQAFRERSVPSQPPRCR